MFSTIGSIIAAILILSVLVSLHEFGHYAVGRVFHLPINEFAIGFGPRLWSTDKNGIRYSLRAFPLGGYCSFRGEEEGSDSPDSFFAHAAWKRALMTIAGPAMNLLFGFIMTVFILVVVGEMMVVPVVDTIVPGSPAANAGIMAGDRIVAVNGVRMEDTSSIVEAITSQGEKTVALQFVRDGVTRESSVTPYYDNELERLRVGLSFGYERTWLGLGESLSLSVKYCVYVVREMLGAFGNLFRGRGFDDVGGPVGTISLISQSVKSGLDTVLHMVVLLSINLGVFNLLPLPALDGGRLLFLGVEMVRRRPVNRDKEAWVHYVGLIALLALVVVFTFKDIQKLITG